MGCGCPSAVRRLALGRGLGRQTRRPDRQTQQIPAVAVHSRETSMTGQCVALCFEYSPISRRFPEHPARVGSQLRSLPEPEGACVREAPRYCWSVRPKSVRGSLANANAARASDRRPSRSASLSSMSWNLSSMGQVNKEKSPQQCDHYCGPSADAEPAPVW